MICRRIILYKRGKAGASVGQFSSADDMFLQTQQNHPGVEPAIGMLQSGQWHGALSGSELGFERYVSLAILGRNMHTLGRRQITTEAADSVAASTRRKAP